MLKSIFKAALLILVISLDSYAQTTTENIIIEWEKQARQYELSEEKSLYYFYFEGAHYDNSQPTIPIFSKQIKLRQYGDLNVQLSNTVYEPLQNVENIDLSTINNIEITTATSFARKQPIGVLSFIPIRKNPTTGVYEKLIQADLQIDIVPKNSPYSNISNSRNFTNTSKLANGLLYKIAVTNTGVQKLDYDFLKSLGVDVDNIDPRKIQLLGNGGKELTERMDVPIVDDIIENNIFVSGEADGSFDKDDYILFYGIGTKNWAYNINGTCGHYKHQINHYSNESYYFIKISPVNGLRITNRASISSTNYTTDSYDALAEHEVDKLNLMEEGRDLPPSGREWYGESFRTTRTQSFNFSFHNRIEQEPVSIQSKLAGRVLTSPGSASLKANTQLIGNPVIINPVSGETYDEYAKRLSFPCRSSVLAGQDINVEINLEHTSSNANMWLDYLFLQARCRLVFDNGQFTFRDSRSLGQGSTTYQISNANGLTIWDVTDPSTVYAQEYTGNGTISFGTDASVLREFVAFDNNQFYIPLEKGLVNNQNLHGMLTPPDAVFIVHSSLKSEAERLATHRRNHSNMTVDVIDVADIYNEFSSGIPDITAIRNFCRMLYKRETLTEKFTHLLLFGVGSFDYKSIGSGRSEVDNLIPLYQTTESIHPINTYTSDDYFALLDDTERMSNFGLLDIAVGRLPASTINEATTLVDKIIYYDTSTNNLRDWKNRLCFIADDEDGNDHFNYSEGIINVATQNDSSYNIDKIYLDAFRQVSTSGGERYPDAKDALLDALFKGSFIVNYLGHGRDDGWTTERIFTSNDITKLSNKDKLSFFITATCSFSPHDNPNLVSAGELLLLNPKGGAIAILTTVRVVLSSHNENLVRNTFRVIFDKKQNGEMHTTGEILQQSKNNATLSSTVNARKYALLGDPTMKLAYPKHNIRTTKINNHPITNQDTIKALELVTISGEIVNDNGQKVSDFNGTIYPTVFDKEDRLFTLGNDAGKSYPTDFMLRKKIVFKGQASVTNGNFTFSFMVPKDINYTIGYGKISYYAEGKNSLDAHGYYNELLIGGSSSNPPIDNKGPEVLVYMNTEEFARGGITDHNPKLLVKLYDEHGINTVGNNIGHDLVGKLSSDDIAQETEYILNDFYESKKDDFKNGTVLYPLKDLAPGLYHVDVKAWDVFNNPGEGSTEFVVAESADMALAHVLNYPNPFTTSTNFQFEHNLPYQSLDIQVQIYTVSGKLIKTIDHNIYAEENNGYRVDNIHWNGLDDYGDRIGKGVYIYKILVQAETTEDLQQSSKFQKLVILK